MPIVEEKQKNQREKNVVLLIILVIIVLLIIIIWLLNYNKSEQDLKLQVYVPVPEGSMEVGEIGEIEEGKTLMDINPEAVEESIRPLNMPIPNHIFNTAGVILEIRGNSLIVRGNGSNFDDQAKRDLTIVIDEETRIDGLRGNLEIFKKSLNIGDQITIESPYNIHGKTEFLARYINTIID